MMDVNSFLVGTILAFARVSSFLFFIPFLRGQYIPTMSKLIISLSIALFASKEMAAIELETMTAFLFLLVAQVMIGLALAFFVEMFFQVAQMVGSLMDFDMGLAMAEVVDPSNGRRVTVMASIYNILFIVVFLSVGGLNTLIVQILYSFKFTSAGFFLGETSFIELLLVVFMYMMTATIQIALPFMATIFIINFVFLIIGRASPQMNIFANMFIVKILIGFLFLYIVLPILGEVFVLMNDVMTERIFEVMEEMFTK